MFPWLVGTDTKLSIQNSVELTSLISVGTGKVTRGCFGGNKNVSLIPSHPQPSLCMSCLNAPCFPSHLMAGCCYCGEISLFILFTSSVFSIPVHPNDRK